MGVYFVYILFVLFIESCFFLKIVVSACLLLATKVEESLCKVSAILSGLKGILGHAGYLNAIPPSTTKRRGGHMEIDEAMAWPLRIQETVILEVLGFDIEVILLFFLFF